MKNFKVLEGCLEQVEISFICIEFRLIPPESEWFHNRKSINALHVVTIIHAFSYFV